MKDLSHFCGCLECPLPLSRVSLPGMCKKPCWDPLGSGAALSSGTEPWRWPELGSAMPVSSYRPPNTGQHSRLPLACSHSHGHSQPWRVLQEFARRVRVLPPSRPPCPRGAAPAPASLWPLHGIAWILEMVPETHNSKGAPAKPSLAFEKDFEVQKSHPVWFPYLRRRIKKGFSQEELEGHDPHGHSAAGRVSLTSPITAFLSSCAHTSHNGKVKHSWGTSESDVDLPPEFKCTECHFPNCLEL